MSNVRLCHFADPEQLNQQFAQQLADLLQQAIEKRQHANLVVSGGKTPEGLFKSLASQAIDWEKVTICLADERIVAHTDAASNEYLIRRTLLQDKAAQANFISLTMDKWGNALDLAVINQTIDHLPPFDAVVLGLGDDAHTASLFPCSDEINHGLADDTAEAVIEVHPKTAAYSRLTLTKNRLCKTKALFFHITGEKKLHLIQQLIHEAPTAEKPASIFLHDSTLTIQVMYA